MSQSLYVYSIFHSISGEAGILPQGSPVTFIRLAGCNIRCKWCDTKKTWDQSAGEKLPLDDIVTRVKLIGCRNVLITGGEPLVQKDDLGTLLVLLDRGGYNTYIETNGTIAKPPQAGFDCVAGYVVDYKLMGSGVVHRQPNISSFPLNKTVVKFVCADRNDFDCAIRVVDLLPVGYKIAFSPVGSVLHPTQLAEWMLLAGHSDHIFSLQIHKYIWPDGEKGDK